MSSHGIASSPKSPQSLREWKRKTSVVLTPRDKATKTIDRAVAAFLDAADRAHSSAASEEHVAAKTSWNDLNAAFDDNHGALPPKRKARVEKQFARLQSRGAECMAFDELRVLESDDELRGARRDGGGEQAKWSAAIERALNAAAPYVEERCPLCPWEAPEQSRAKLLAYITDVLNNDSFQKDPPAYLRAWDVRRGSTEEFRVSEDSARQFFKEHFKLQAQ